MQAFSIDKEKGGPLWPILLFVVGLHAILLVWALIFPGASVPKPVPKRDKKLLVQTVKLQPPLLAQAEEKEIPTAAAIPEEPLKPEPPIAPAPPEVKKKVEPPKKSTPAPPKKVEKKPEKPKPTPAKKPTPKKAEKPPAKAKKEAAPAPKPAKKEPPKKAAPEKSSTDIAAEKAAVQKRKLLAQAEEKIAKIGKNSDKGVPEKKEGAILAAIPGKISSLEIEQLPGVQVAPLSDREISYRDELAGRLKLLLRLPEIGEVRIKLTLEQSGKVAKVTIMGAESALNRQYIEKTLPTLSFPPLVSGEAQATFTITLSNEL